MSNQSDTTIYALLDGIEGQIKAVRELLKNRVEQSTACQHPEMKTIETMGGVQGGFCGDCGAEFVLGVLEAEENNK